MALIVDDLGRHLPPAGSIERTAVPMGLHLAWCVNLQLIGQLLHQRTQAPLLRLRELHCRRMRRIRSLPSTQTPLLRLRELRGGELLLTPCGGALRREDLNEAGLRFTDAYLWPLSRRFAHSGQWRPLRHGRRLAAL